MSDYNYCHDKCHRDCTAKLWFSDNPLSFDACYEECMEKCYGEWDDCMRRCMSECPFKDYYMCLENCEAVCMDEEPVIEGDYEEEWEEEVMSDG